MAKEIRVPQLGESVTEATIGKWFKAEGDAVKVDEPLVELETDKVTVEVPAPAARRPVIDRSATRADRECRRAPWRHRGRRGGCCRSAQGGGKARKSRRAEEGGRASASGCRERRGQAAVARGAQDRRREQARSRRSIAGSGKDGRLTKGDVLAEITKPTPPPAFQLPPAAPAQPAVLKGAFARRPMPSARSACACRGCARPSRAA